MRKSAIIIGGGVAGLSAALELADSHQVTLLEARDRLGGRINTIRPHGLPIELGAEFIHGRSPELIRLITRSSLQTHEPPDRHWKESNGQLIELPDFWEQISTVTDDIKKNARDTTFLEILQRAHEPAESLALAKGFVEGFHGADIKKVSAKEILRSEESAEEIDGQKNLRIHAGYDKLITSLVDQCRQRQVQIHTSTPVAAIHWKSKPTVITSHSQFTADAIIIALPIGVLRAGAIHFDPLPTKKFDAINAIEPATITKLILHFREPFWREPDFGFLHTNDPWFPTWWTDPRGPILTAWAGGPQGKALADHTSDFILHRALETVSRLFGETVPRLRQLLIAAHNHNWTHDPFTRGAYSYLPVGALDAPKILAQPEAEKLYFAGEAIDLTHQQGTVHAALISGQRAASLLKS